VFRLSVIFAFPFVGGSFIDKDAGEPDFFPHSVERCTHG
jgi:hypothetical protein